MLFLFVFLFLSETFCGKKKYGRTLFFFLRMCMHECMCTYVSFYLFLLTELFFLFLLFCGGVNGLCFDLLVYFIFS